MSDAVITVENLSKRYLIGHRSGKEGPDRYTALRDVIGREARNFVRKAVNLFRGQQVVQGDTGRGILGAQGRKLGDQAG